MVNVIDILFVALLLAGMAVGFLQGVIRLTIAIVSLYVGIILSSLYFQLIGEWARTQFAMNLDVAQIITFGVLVVAATAVLVAAMSYTFHYYAHIPESAVIVDRGGGALLGFIWSCMALALFAAVLSALFVYRNPAIVAELQLARALQTQIRESDLVDYFVQNVLPLLHQSVRPLLPEAAGMIFQGQ